VISAAVEGATIENDMAIERSTCEYAVIAGCQISLVKEEFYCRVYPSGDPNLFIGLFRYPNRRIASFDKKINAASKNETCLKNPIDLAHILE
jgi:hypothetical protein